jgi:hypothetical protein
MIRQVDLQPEVKANHEVGHKHGLLYGLISIPVIKGFFVVLIVILRINIVITGAV